MSKDSVLIADGSEDFCRALMDSLSDSCDVLVCTSGLEAAQLLHTRAPDVLVLNLILPELDGLSLLRNMKNFGQKPLVVVCTDYISPWLLTTLQELGVSCVFQKPCPVITVKQQVCSLLCESRTPDRQEIRGQISDLLLKLGFSAKFRGYDYLKEAITCAVLYPDRPIIQRIYGDVALYFGVTEKIVERSIRITLRGVWEKRNTGTWQPFFGQKRTRKPHSATVIRILAESIRREDGIPRSRASGE